MLVLHRYTRSSFLSCILSSISHSASRRSPSIKTHQHTELLSFHKTKADKTSTTIMQFHNFLLTAVFTSLSIAVPVTTTTTSISSCVATSLSPPPPNKHCGDQGTLTNPSLLSTAITTTFNDCTNTCLVSNACQSFSFDSSKFKGGPYNS